MNPQSFSMTTTYFVVVIDIFKRRSEFVHIRDFIIAGLAGTKQ